MARSIGFHWLGVIALCVVCIVGCGKQERNLGSKPKAGVAVVGKGVSVNPKDGATMVLIPAGKFTMGSTDADKQAGANQKPQHTVHLDSFLIYRDLVTVAQYREFCKATGREMPEAPDWGWVDDHPIVLVTWDDASAYAQWAGASLPTEAQWEKAARGTDGRTYPWGNNWENGRLHCSKGTWGDARKTAPVGSCGSGASPYGVMDMAGNATQWCADYYESKYYRTSPSKNPTGPASGNGRVIRGGSWTSEASGTFHTARRTGSHPAIRFMGTGFRCVVKLQGT
jgi:formylglycine-generating enzyme required for sulfatase activity